MNNVPDASRLGHHGLRQASRGLRRLQTKIHVTLSINYINLGKKNIIKKITGSKARLRILEL